MGGAPRAVATGALTPPESVSPGAATPTGALRRASSDAVQPDLAGRLQGALGPAYAVERVLGEGGFAVVFLVRDLSLKRPLAVKVLSPDLVASAKVLERFHREAETVAQLSHPNIVPLHFIGHEGDLVYLAMALVDGESLADRLARERALSVAEATRIMQEVAGALDHAHRRGVIHRDIKPQNVLLERESGRALVTDFGIARTAESASLTTAGMVVGTPTYMSPEQVVGGDVDHRADLYALGTMTFEMLAGKPPFTGSTPTETLMRRVAHPAERIETMRPDVSAQLAEAVNRCLEAEPGNRVQSAAEIVRALGGVTPVSGSVATREVGARRRRPPPWAALAGGAGIMVAAFAGYVIWRSVAPSRAASGPVEGAAPRGMIAIPAGSYTIGRYDAHSYSRPAHRVSLGTFAIDAREVTVGQYRAFVAAAGAPEPWQVAPDSALPVTGVSWTEAAAYCAWRTPGARLPTEEEWEAAARGPAALIYPWGNEPRSRAANTLSLGAGRALPVGSVPAGATPTGLYDLIGNVWEWTSSRMLPYSGGASPPRGRDYYVIRGGAFNTPDSIADATRRGYVPATTHSRADLAATGFRCAVPLGARTDSLSR